MGLEIPIRITDLDETNLSVAGDYLVIDTGTDTYKIKKSNLFLGVYSLPTGGSNHQLLWKVGDEDGEAEWHTLTPEDIGLGNVFNLKGSKPTVEDLPATGNHIGDVWYVVDESVGYIWINDDQDVERWEQLGMSIDLSNYVQKTDFASASIPGVIRIGRGLSIDSSGVVTANAVPAGGTANKVLTKNSNQDADADWLSDAVYFGEVESEETPIVNADRLENHPASYFAYANYALFPLSTDDWGEDTLDGEDCYSVTKQLQNAVAGRHPIMSCLPTSIATMDDENEAFSLIVKLVEGNGNIKIYAKELPAVDFEVQVANY